MSDKKKAGLSVNRNHTKAEPSSFFQEMENDVVWVRLFGIVILLPAIAIGMFKYESRPIEIPEILKPSVYKQTTGHTMYEPGHFMYTKDAQVTYIEAKEYTGELNLALEAYGYYGYDGYYHREDELDLNSISLDFLENYPNVHSLVVGVDNTNTSWDILKSLPYMESITKLTLKNTVKYSATYLEDDYLQFMGNLPNLKSLDLQLCRTGFSSGFIEYYCPNLETLTISHWGRYTNYSIDFSFFSNLKELNICDSYTLDVASCFSREDYQELLDRGVNVKFSHIRYSSFSDDEYVSLFDFWDLLDAYYNLLNLDSYTNPKEKVDAILVGMLEGKISYSSHKEASMLLKALTNRCGIYSYYVDIVADNPKDASSCCFIDVYDNGEFYYFNPKALEKDVVFSNKTETNISAVEAIKTGQTHGLVGYMRPLEDLTEKELKGMWCEFITSGNEKALKKR